MGTGPRSCWTLQENPFFAITPAFHSGTRQSDLEAMEGSAGLVHCTSITNHLAPRGFGPWLQDSCGIRAGATPF